MVADHEVIGYPSKCLYRQAFKGLDWFSTGRQTGLSRERIRYPAGRSVSLWMLLSGGRINPGNYTGLDTGFRRDWIEEEVDRKFQRPVS